ncbi:MAG: MFS transporter [Actinomycetota bacterium]
MISTRPNADRRPTRSPGARLAGVFAFWGWRVVAAGAVSQMLISGMVMHAYTHYSVLLRAEFGWSTTLIAIGFAMNRLESGLLGPVQGWMVDRFGPRAVMRVGAVILWAGLLAFSTLQNAFQFFAYFLVMALGASLAGFLTVVTAVVGWFERRRSTALALAQAGYPLGGIIVPIVVFSLTRFGWRATAFWSAWIVLVAVLALAQVMHGDPEAVGQEVDGGPPPDDDGASALERKLHDVGGPERDFTLGEAVRTRAFWMLNLGHASALLVVASTMAHLSIYLTEEQGFSLTMAGFLGTALMMTQLVGQMGGGWLGDRYSKQRLVTLAMGGHLVGMVLFTFASAPWMVWAFVPFHGLAWGVRGPLLQAIRADYFGTSSFGRIMGWSSMIMMLGTMSGPIVVGVLRDATGTYTLGFGVVTALASLAIGFFLLASRPQVPEPAAASAP